MYVFYIILKKARVCIATIKQFFAKEQSCSQYVGVGARRRKSSFLIEVLWIINNNASLRNKQPASNSKSTEPCLFAVTITLNIIEKVF